MNRQNTTYRWLILLGASLLGLFLLLFLQQWLQPSATVQAVALPFDAHATPFGSGNDNTESVAAADLNGDGHLDIIVGNSEQQNAVYWNDGNGGFAAPPTLFGSANDGTYSVAAADLNGDGHLDIIVGNLGRQNAVYWNDGNGGFAALPAFFGSGSDSTLSVAAADLNGDGHLDVIVGNWDQQNAVYWNDGSGGFAALPAFFGSANDHTYSVAAADLNRDGHLDMIVGNRDQQNAVYWNDGSGGFAAPPTLFGSANDHTYSVAAADLNGDGHLDMVVGNREQQNAVYWNDGSGGLASSPTLFGSANDSTESVAAADLNGDGHLDMIVGNREQQNAVYWNDGSGGLASSPTLFGSANDSTESVAAADLNGDGHLDIIVGNDFWQNAVYWNDGSGGLASSPTLFGSANDHTSSVAAADLNRDGHPDMIVGNIFEQNAVYWNDGSGGFAAPPTLLGSVKDDTYSVAAADLNRDGHLDIIVGNLEQQNAVYWNDGSGGFEALPTFFGSVNDGTLSVAAADLNGDGHLDIIVGNWGQQNAVYWNDGSGGFAAPSNPFGSGSDSTWSVAAADLNGDGHLDVIVGNEVGQNAVYWNDGSGGFAAPPTLFGSGSDSTLSVAAADLNGDGHLDIIVGNWDLQNAVYWNDGSGGFAALPTFLGSANDHTYSVAAADLNGDGHLDMIVGNREQQNAVYWNDGSGGFAAPSNPFGSGSDSTESVAAADLNGDGHPDVIVGNSEQQNAVYWNKLYSAKGQPNQPPTLITSRPVTTAKANFFSSPQLLSAPIITIPFTLSDPESDPVARIAAFYSQDGGDNWREAVAGSGATSQRLFTSPTGISYTYLWDVAASEVYGRSDNVVLRLVAYSQPAAGTITTVGTYRYINSVASLNQWATVSATTFPFSLQGTQARVLQQTNAGLSPIADALVYNLPAGLTTGATKLRDDSHPALPQKTDRNGLYPGRPPIRIGDRLIALSPLPNNGDITFTNKISLYHTSAAAANDGLAMHFVMNSGVQTLTTTTDNTLMVLNLDLSLEWDARNDPFYLTKLETDLNQASRYLFDWSNGQVALGKVRIFQAKENWYYSDIVVHSNNQYRPNATVGGIVTTTLSQTLRSGIVITDAYRPGQIHMGASWNRFGQPGGGQVDDWAEALAHEIGHYALFLQDNYFGVDSEGNFTVTDCQGSAMTNPYQSNYSEFLSSNGWNGECLNTLAETVLGKDDWKLLRSHWPRLAQNGGEGFAGPSQLPLALLEMEPVSSTTDPALADRIIELVDSEGNALDNFGPQAQGYLFKTRGTADITDDSVVALGVPEISGLRLRGLTPGDRLCLLDFTPSTRRSGCADGLDATTQSLTITQLSLWEPQVEVNIVSTTTVQISVTLDLSSAQALENDLWVQVLPAASVDGASTTTAPALAVSNRVTTTEAVVFSQVVTTTEPIFDAFVRVWDSGASAKEVMTKLRLNGDWPVPRFTGGELVPRFTGGDMAPVMSGDGQALLLSTDPAAFFKRNFQASLQTVSILPELPSWLSPVSNGYRFTLAEEGAFSDPYTIVVQYLQSNVANAFEPHLYIYYQPEGSSEWQQLQSYRDTDDNLVSANVLNNAVQGQGIYVLVTAVHAPTLETGWNELVFPLPGVQPITNALASVAEATTSVYGFDLDTYSWQLYDYTVLTEQPDFAPLVNDLATLQFGQSYWVYATETVTPIIPVRGPQDFSSASQANNGSFLPATFYGLVSATGEFTPTVTAMVGDVSCGTGKVTKLDGQFAYVIQVKADSGEGCGRSGQEVTFTVDGEPMSNKSCWENSQAHYHDLSSENVNEPICTAVYKLFLPISPRLIFP